MKKNHKVLKIRREYNQWVANETLEDFALRYTAKQARRWSAGRVASTALGIVSFLALEAIGGTITLNFGFDNAMWAILVVGLIIFLTGLPLSYYAARYGVDIDLLTRGAGFGYIGSTISSLVYASFTFIFFALEAAIMSMAIHLLIPIIPIALAYTISALLVIPLVTHGISRISFFQFWTQPVWLVLQIAPLLFIATHESSSFGQWIHFPGLEQTDGEPGFSLALFGAAAAVIFPLIAQNGEQADFLRFLPEKNQNNPNQWWVAVVGAGPGWVIVGIIKLFIGSFLAVLALKQGLPADLATDPTHMYTVAFGYIAFTPSVALWLACLFVIISQLKINVTNAYAGSIAWANFFSRLTHSHPGRVVWLFFNVAIALMLMELGLYEAFETILTTYSSLVVAWVGCVVADLVINKPLGLSPRHIEFRRSHLFDINPVGVVSMVTASIVGISAHFGLFGNTVQALAPFLSLLLPFILVPLIARITQGRYYLAQATEEFEIHGEKQRCHVCENLFDQEDMSHCPSYDSPICSLCCALDSRCGDQCRPDAHLAAQSAQLFKKLLPKRLYQTLHSTTGHFLAIFTITAFVIGLLLVMVHSAQQQATAADSLLVGNILWQVFFLLLLVTGVLVWLYVLAQRGTRLALEEARSQTTLLQKEAMAHEATAIELALARDTANAANLAKSRYLSGVSHELRTPLNTIFGYSQIMEGNRALDSHTRKVASVIKLSSEHLSDVIEGLLEISKIEARKFDLHRDPVDLHSLLKHLEDMFQPQANQKGIRFSVICQPELPRFVLSDEKRLRQILLNLLSNAIKFTSEGKVELVINYRNQVGRMCVRDTGIGIAEEDQERIFEPFERACYDGRADSGTGLGLSISRLLAEMMGGSLELNSHPDSGSEFCLRLLLPVATQELSTFRSRNDITGYLGPDRHILVVDDEDTHRQLMTDLLTPLGFTVHQTRSGKDALELLKKQDIDLFLLDISMPEMNGWELLSRLRKSGNSRPVIILSANQDHNASNPEPLREYDAFVSKPIRLEKLLEQVQRCLGLKWSHANEDQPNTAAPAIELPQTNLIDSETLDAMKGFARIGYLQGILDNIEQLEQAPAPVQGIEQLRKLADRCDLTGIIEAVDSMQNHLSPDPSAKQQNNKPL